MLFYLLYVCVCLCPKTTLFCHRDSKQTVKLRISILKFRIFPKMYTWILLYTLCVCVYIGHKFVLIYVGAINLMDWLNIACFVSKNPWICFATLTHHFATISCFKCKIIRFISLICFRKYYKYYHKMIIFCIKLCKSGIYFQHEAELSLCRIRPFCAKFSFKCLIFKSDRQQLAVFN